MADFFGLDIGSYSIKAVQVEKKGKEIKLLHFTTLSTPPRVFESEAEKDRKLLSQAIKDVTREAGISARSVVASLPESRLFTRVVEFPKMTEKELASSLEFEAARFIPLPIDTVDFDFEVVSRPEEGDQVDVLLVAAPKSLTDRYVGALEGAGLSILALEPEAAALVRALVVKGEKTPVPTLLVSIGSSTTDLIIAEEGKIRFTRSVATGGKALGRALARSLGFEEEQAESYKRSYGLEEGKLEGKIGEVLQPIFKVIVGEMKKSLDFYSSRKRNKEVRRIVLSGGTANLPGVLVYFASEFGLEIQMANPWEGIVLPEGLDREEMEELGPSLAVAVGLSLREE